MTERFVYFAERDGFIKIGCSRRPHLRVRDLHARPLAIVPGDYMLERYYHHQFAGSAIGHEWFHPTLDLLAFIATQPMEPAPPPRVLSLTTGKVAALFNVTPDTVRRWADTGLLPVWRTPGGTRRFWRDDIEPLVRPAQPKKAAAS